MDALILIALALVLITGAAIAIVVGSRANRLDEDGPDTIVIPPALEPDGTVYPADRVDISAFNRRYAED